MFFWCFFLYHCNDILGSFREIGEIVSHSKNIMYGYIKISNHKCKPGLYNFQTKMHYTSFILLNFRFKNLCPHLQQNQSYNYLA